MSRYHLTTAPLGLASAEAFADYLAQYEIQAAGLTVQHEDEQGRYHNDRTLQVAISTQLAPLAATGPAAGIAGVASAVGCAPTLAVLLAPVAAIVAPVLPVALPALLVANSANGAALARYERKWGGAARPGSIASHITFRLVDVSPERLAWAERLISIYCIRAGWHIEGLRHSESYAGAARWAATHAGYHPAWRNQPGRPSASPRHPNRIAAQSKHPERSGAQSKDTRRPARPQSKRVSRLAQFIKEEFDL